ncbi:LysE family translocator [Acidovorax sp. NCPPB 3859]|nr:MULTISPECIES: LysE family translocator [Comamonadaceae]AVS68722.1 LysE family translocator [Paracidovorax avenae]AVT14183.1 LysE family translocator [Paracidovorax avenae]MDA8451872.1 LysE family translocator [Acidovorax sp. GBBC 3297]MDA8461318.1 LysE family translocator [Acidovorax sp. GBBC 3333]MDA8466351.1 LysE family translocator [Acidovorax sp. GBBC 3332]
MSAFTFTPQELLLFALAALVLVLTPGPNMVYCVSRSLTQGPRAGLLSLAGVVAGFGVHLLATALGLSALLVAVPLAFDVLRIAGAAYLLWMAWQAVKPGGSAPFEARDLPHDGPRKLVLMGFLTSALNPKVAMFYVSFFPQFLHPERGQWLAQTFTLGALQIGISALVNALLVLFAARVARFLHRSAAWVRAQRYLMGTVLGVLALKILFTERKATP